jgi:hypothetical protein
VALGTEALALAMEVSVLEAKRLGHRAVLRLSWLLLVASVALVHPAPGRRGPTHPGRVCDRRRNPVWLLGSFAVLSLLYRAEVSADPAPGVAEGSADGAAVSAAQLATGAGLSASYARALVAEFQTRPPVALQHNGHPSPSSVMAQSDPTPTREVAP